MDDSEAMYRAGRARQGGTKAPSGGGYSNGGRVARQAYSSGGMVMADTLEDGRGRAKPFTTEEAGPKTKGYARGGRVDGGGGTGEATPRAPGGMIGGADRRLAAQQAGRPIGRKGGGRVPGKGC